MYSNERCSRKKLQTRTYQIVLSSKVSKSREMTEVTTLSLEETNELRKKLGLKPIPVNDKDSFTSDGASDESVDLKSNLPDKERIHFLRKKIAKLNDDRSLTRFEDEKNVDLSKEDWLKQIGNVPNKTSARKPVKISYEEDDDELPLLKLTHDVKDIATSKGTILTLKENDIHSGDNDVLESENLVHDKEDAKRVQLREMNRDRRRMRKKLQVSSAEIEASEKVDDNSVLLIGAESSLKNNVNVDKGAEAPDGKIKVTFNDFEDDAGSDSGDFKSVKIKKRKKNAASGRVKNNGIQLPAKIEAVKLMDNDLSLGDQDEDFYVPTNSVKKSKLKSKIKTPEEVALEIKREKAERDERAAKVAQTQKGIKKVIIDEGRTFLESLKSNLIDDGKPSEADPTIVTHATSNTTTNTEKVTSETKEVKEPDFYDGLASTLQFLQGRNVLPKAQNIRSSVQDTNVRVVPEQHEEVSKIRQRIAEELYNGDTRYTAKELEEIKKYEEKQIAKHVNELQSSKLQAYNPEVNLVYKDENGNQLTTKEAYKKLSQKFHGTKSNKKKQAKAQSKIEARKRQAREANFFEML